MNRSRLIIADDHALVLEGLARLLKGEEFEVTGSTTDGRKLVEMCQRTNPDVVVMDVNLTALNGLDAARQIRKTMPRIKLIFLTVHLDAENVRAAFHSGANGYIVKQCALEEVFTAIREVAKGNCYVTPLLAADLLSCLTKPFGTARRGRLTARQSEVLGLVAEGRAAKEIAEILRISPKTVEYHKAVIQGKLGLHSTPELIRYAFENGLANFSKQACA
jgi:DNA-binding NarL/FixJ family response regulator